MKNKLLLSFLVFIFSITFISAYCGDGLLDIPNGEMCDDGGFIWYDGCTPRCQIDEEFMIPNGYCGDGWINGIEECDDGGFINLDGCSNICKHESKKEIKREVKIFKKLTKFIMKFYRK